MLRPDNTLTARVIVNRIWHHMIGRGLVGTPDNFGKLGEQPTHPELLDYLARRFVAEGWSIKKLVREITLTRTFQLAVAPSGNAAETDPENRLLARANVRRLEAEAIRDAMRRQAVRWIEVAWWIGQCRQQSAQPLPADHSQSTNLFLTVMDAPVPTSTTGAAMTNVPAQSLTMMNDPFIISGRAVRQSC